MTSQYSLGTNNNFYYVHHSKNFSASLSKYQGRHSLKGGFDYRRIHDDGNDFANSAGAFTFNGVFSRSTPLTAVAGTGADLADMLLGAPSAGTGYIPTKLYEYADYYGAYFQDDIRITKSLTVNIGMRWEREYGLQEKNNSMVVGFDTKTVNPLAANVTGILPKGVIEFAGVNGNSIHVSNPNLNKLAPRVGIAWQVAPKTTIRGGYGMFWAPQFAIGTPYNPPGYTATSTYVASNDGNATPANSLTNPFPGGLARPTGSTLGDLTGIGQSLSIIDPNARSPRVQQYSFDVQRELPFGVAMEVGYVGSHSTHLTQATANININALNPALLSQGAALTATVANPFFNKGGAGVIGSATLSQVQLLLPYPTFSTINLQYNDSSHARYDSLVAKAQKRMSMGMTVLSTLTWSRNHDASSGGAGNFLNAGSPVRRIPTTWVRSTAWRTWTRRCAGPRASPSSCRSARTRSSWARSKALDYAVGGWSVNAVSVYQSGFPHADHAEHQQQLGVRLRQPAPERLRHFAGDERQPGEPAEQLHQRGSLHDGGARHLRQHCRGRSRCADPGQANWDISIFKSISITEKFKGQFRAEALNAFNTPMFAAPNTSFGSSSFGRITSQVNFSRMMQLGMRFFF